VKELAESICTLVRPDLPILFEPDRPIGGRTIPTLPMHPVLQSMKWTSLSEGLKKTFDSWNAV
jgi:hypothetical protein